MIAVYPVSTDVESAAAKHGLPEKCILEPAKGRPNGAILIYWQDDPEATDAVFEWVVAWRDAGEISPIECERLCGQLFERSSAGRVYEQQQRTERHLAEEAARCKHPTLAGAAVVTAYQCSECQAIASEVAPLRECPHCEEQFVSWDRECPQCNRPFSRRLADLGCVECERGECEEVQARVCPDCDEYVKVEGAA